MEEHIVKEHLSSAAKTKFIIKATNSIEETLFKTLFITSNISCLFATASNSYGENFFSIY